MPPFSSQSPCPPVRGFTLVEVAVVLAVVGILASLVLPSAFGAAAKGRRTDAVLALGRIQMAQEQHRSVHGGYAPVGAGNTGVRSELGHYDVVVLDVRADAFEAVAMARADSPQARDEPCTRITLSVKEGFAQWGPSAQCWNQ